MFNSLQQTIIYSSIFITFSDSKLNITNDLIDGIPTDQLMINTAHRIENFIDRYLYILNKQITTKAALFLSA